MTVNANGHTTRIHKFTHIHDDSQKSLVPSPFCAITLTLERVQSLAAASYGHEDVQVEAVVGFPEEQKQDKAEETRSDQTPIQP